MFETEDRIVGSTKIEDVLRRDVVSVTSRAKALGVVPGMSGSEGLEKMNVKKSMKKEGGKINDRNQNRW